MLELGSPQLSNVMCKDGNKRQTEETPEGPTPGSLLVCELRRQAGELGVPVAALSVRMVLDRLLEITAAQGKETEKQQQEQKEGEEEEKEGYGRRTLLSSSQRVHVCVLLQSTRELLALGAFCPRLFWHEYWKDQKQVNLEVVHHLHSQDILTVKYILESNEGVRLWLVSGLKALCGWKAKEDEQEGREVQHMVLSKMLKVLVEAGFEENQDQAAPNRTVSALCRSVLDDMLSWVLDAVDDKGTQQSKPAAAEIWIQLFDVSLCGASVSPEALHLFFTHALTHTLTYKPQLKVSDAITMQNEWSFAKTSRLLTSLFRKLAVIVSVEKLLSHLQQVLETHEVNWRHVLSFLSTVLVYNPHTQPSLTELLSRLLSSAFESYDLENMITAFLLARQGALEGPGLFLSYSDWFKVSFGGASGYHGNSKKSLVFLLKFLSDLVPFDPPQYLKVHILHPPYVAVKHRSLLSEYVSLAKTRLADLKVAVEDMGLYEDVSGAAGAPVQPQCQALQDVEKAVSLFDSTGRISATVMEASIFRRPYFLTRFLPALLRPRVLPVKPDAQMNFIEALKKADKIPAAQYSSYVESCLKERQRQTDRVTVCVENDDDPQEVLKLQLDELRKLVADSVDAEVSAQLSRMSHTLSVIFPSCPEELIGQTIVKLHTNTPLSPDLHLKVVNMILRNFCQCILDTSRTNPPNKQSLWSAQFVSILLGHTQLVCALLHRLWHLFHSQASSLNAAHVVGLAAFVVHLNASNSQSPLVQIVPSCLPKPVPIIEALSSALDCSTHANMVFCVRFCVAAMCYGICRTDPSSQQPEHQEQQQQQDYVPTSLYKKLLYLIPRLMPDVGRSPVNMDGFFEGQGESHSGLWRNVTDTIKTWRRSAQDLWRHPSFRQLAQLPQYQLSFSEWLATELRVQRSQDALSDPDRQEYQQWVCVDVYLSRPVNQGGCGGDIRMLCTVMLNAIMDQQHTHRSLDKSENRPSETGTCLPDILSRLQELVYEMELTNQSNSTSRGSRDDTCHFLLEVVSQRCSSLVTSDPQSIGKELSLQHTLQAWNRVLLALPAVLFIVVRSEGGRRTLDCQSLIDHINQHQRNVCFPAGLLPFHLTAHFVKGLLSASVRCPSPSEEVNKAWCHITVHCPLLLLSTACWWSRLRPMLVSLWGRLCGGGSLPDQLQLLDQSHRWASSSARAVSTPSPAAPALLLACCLHQAWAEHPGNQEQNLGLKGTLGLLGKDRQHRQVAVYLLFLCMRDLLASYLHPQEVKFSLSARELCTDILTAVVDSSDWLLIFRSPGTEQGCFQLVTAVPPDEYTRLMPLAFYSLLLQQSAELLNRTAKSPGFLYTAVLCYIALLKLFLDGQTPHPITEAHADQIEVSQVLRGAQQLVLRIISQASPTALSSNQLSQLESQCSELDPEVAAALSSHVSLDALSQEMDFL